MTTQMGYGIPATNDGSDSVVIVGPVEVSEPVTVDAVDLDLRDLSFDLDNVRQAMRSMQVLHTTVAAGGSDSIVVGPTGRLRILRIDGGCTPDTADGVFPTYAINLDIGNGDETIRGKTLQAGEPIGGTFCLEGVAGADLTVTVTGSGGTVEFDIYFEEFPA